jgi:hypothetical protein
VVDLPAKSRCVGVTLLNSSGMVHLQQDLALFQHLELDLARCRSTARH